MQNVSLEIKIKVVTLSFVFIKIFSCEIFRIYFSYCSMRILLLNNIYNDLFYFSKSTQACALQRLKLTQREWLSFATFYNLRRIYILSFYCLFAYHNPLSENIYPKYNGYDKELSDVYKNINISLKEMSKYYAIFIILNLTPIFLKTRVIIFNVFE